MRISVRLNVEDVARGNPQQTLDLAARLEQAGADLIWVSESWGVDAVSVAATLLNRTSSIHIGTGILPIYSRTPSLIAQTAATLDILGNGRFVLGLGVSGPQVIEGWHGVPFDRPLRRTAEVIEICRKVWSGGKLEHQGLYSLPLAEGGLAEGKALKFLAQGHRTNIPIYVAALGPANVTLTASTAEGWLPTLFVPEWAEEIWGEALTNGRQSRPTALGQLEIAAGGPIVIGDGLGQIRDSWWRPWLAMHLGGYGTRKHNFYNDVLARYGYVDEAREIQDRYLSGDHVGAQAAIPEELVNKMSLVGSESHVAERISAFQKAGVTMLNINPLGTDPLGTVAQVRKLIDRIGG